MKYVNINAFSHAQKVQQIQSKEKKLFFSSYKFSKMVVTFWGVAVAPSRTYVC